MISHIVLYSPKLGLPDGERDALATAVREAFTKIQTVRRYSVGRRVDLGYSYGTVGELTYEYAAVVEFDSQESLADYLVHPLHTALAAMFWKCCGKTLILDVESFGV
jgi:hypothetical protein